MHPVVRHLKFKTIIILFSFLLLRKAVVLSNLYRVWFLPDNKVAWPAIRKPHSCWNIHTRLQPSVWYSNFCCADERQPDQWHVWRKEHWQICDQYRVSQWFNWSLACPECHWGHLWRSSSSFHQRHSTLRQHVPSLQPRCCLSGASQATNIIHNWSMAQIKLLSVMLSTH